MPEPPTIFIVDPDQHARSAVVRLAEQMRISTKQYTNAEAFVEAHPRNLPGCIVAEFRLLGMNGIELQEALIQDCIAMPIIFVTGHAETSFTVRAMRNGAVTVLEKPCSGQELWDALRKGLALNQTMRRVDAQHNELRRCLARLTRKERQVLDLMLDGKTNKAIASKLSVSVRTVESRRQQIFRKTRTESLAELVRVILQADMREDS